jgi:hypothetical protein
MHSKRSAKVWIVTALMALTTTMVGTASQERPADESERRPAITGSWAETVTLAGGSGFKALWTYGEGGDVVASSQGNVVTGPFPFPAAYTPAHGQWTYQGGRTFSTTAVSLASDLYDGHLLIVFKIQQTVTLNRAGNAYRAAFKYEITDPAGNVLFVLEGTTEARRISVEPLN